MGDGCSIRLKKNGSFKAGDQESMSNLDGSCWQDHKERLSVWILVFVPYVPQGGMLQHILLPVRKPQLES